MIGRRHFSVAPDRLETVMLQPEIGEPGRQSAPLAAIANRPDLADIPAIAVENPLRHETAELLPVISEKPIALPVTETSAAPMPEPMSALLRHLLHEMNDGDNERG